MIWVLFVLSGLVAAFLFFELRRQPISTIQAAQSMATFAHLPSGTTGYTLQGPESGQLVVLVHGLTTPSQVYTAIAGHLVAQGMRVLRYDLLGRGTSDRPFVAHNRGLYFRQLNELLDHLGISKQFAIVGYSMGGSIVTAYSSVFPSRVTHTILLASAGLGHAPDRFTRFCRDVPILGDVLFGLMAPSALTNVANAARNSPGEISDIGDVMAEELNRRGYIRSVLSSLRNMLAEDLSQDHIALAQSQTPVLAIWGEADPVVPISAMGRLAQLNPNAQQIVIEDADHGVAYTDATQIAKELRAFVTK